MRTVFLTVAAALLFSGCGAIRSYSYKQPKEPQSAKTKSAKSGDAKMRPYEVNGKSYTPTMVSIGEEFQGIASWYGPDFHGKLTANGEQYNMYDQTAAHKTLPMNTMVRVTNLTNKESVVVRINDRGPFVEGRIIDLSFSAGKKIGLEHSGTAPVRLHVLGFDGAIVASSTAVAPEQKSRVVKNFGIQIGAFKIEENAKKFAASNAIVDGNYRSKVQRFDGSGGSMYRVFLTGFGSEAEAKEFLRQDRFLGAFSISLE